MTDELIGKKIGGYEILSQIGHGGMAAVYRAHQVSMNRVVAIKVLPRHFLNDDTYLQRFHREVKIVSQLEHRNIVPVHDYGEQDGQPYIVMRYMSGGSVDDLLTGGGLPVDHIARILEQVAPALDYAHEKGVLHRDLKPSNVLMDDAGGAYITDFGIARILGDASGGQITTQGVIGTPSYMSPEQAQGQPLDGRSDLYSLGVMLFEMATGRRPFVSDTPYSIAVMQVTTPPPEPRSLNPNLSPAVEEVILRALKKRREERYGSAAALVEALKQAADAPAISLQDTQPGMPRPQLVEQQTVNIPPPPTGFIPPVPAYTTSPVATGTPSQPMVAVPRVRARPRRQGNLLGSVVIGGLIGCGLLTLLVLIGLVIAQNIRQQEEDLRQTETREALTREAATPQPESVSRSESVAQAQGDGATEAPRRLVTNTPAPQRTATAAPPASSPTGVAPVGQRPTMTDIPLAVQGALVYFAERDGNYDIFRMDLPSRVVRQLTNHERSDTYPMVSPDGQYIVFQSDRDGDFDIFIMESNGNNPRRLAQNRVTDRLPAWSPDGQWIVFSSDTRDDGNFDLYRVRPDGSELQPLVSNGARNSHPRWSADNRYLIFTSGGSDDATSWEIRRYDLHAQRVAMLTINNIKDWSPTFTPDDDILYLTDGDGYAAIARMNVNGESVEIIYDGQGYESAACMSPDGQYIAFASDAGGTDQLYVMTADGDDVAQLTTDGGLYPTWFPG